MTPFSTSTATTLRWAALVGLSSSSGFRFLRGNRSGGKEIQLNRSGRNLSRNKSESFLTETNHLNYNIFLPMMFRELSDPCIKPAELRNSVINNHDSSKTDHDGSLVCYMYVVQDTFVFMYKCRNNILLSLFFGYRYLGFSNFLPPSFQLAGPNCKRSHFC